jgi:hypothetical protein
LPAIDLRVGGICCSTPHPLLLLSPVVALLLPSLAAAAVLQWGRHRHCSPVISSFKQKKVEP